MSSARRIGLLLGLRRPSRQAAGAAQSRRGLPHLGDSASLGPIGPPGGPMTSYRRRLEGDLDQWIASGLVAAENREVILATIPQSRRLDAATALAAIGAFLAGAAIIAFIAANWGAIPRLVRFAMILAAFLAAAFAGAWAAGRERIVTKNVLLSLAAMIFAAAIGLTGQIFDIAGDEASALRAAGLAAA